MMDAGHRVQKHGSPDVCRRHLAYESLQPRLQSAFRPNQLTNSTSAPDPNCPANPVKGSRVRDRDLGPELS